MIFDSISNFYMYASIHPQFNSVLNFLSAVNIEDLPAGRHAVNDNGVFAGVDEYGTKEVSEGFIEFHKKYIDIQIVLRGKEKVGLCNKDTARELEFNEEKDFGKLEGDMDFITLKENYFVILFPHDGHMPQMMDGSPERVKKMVIKVPVIPG
ncbi:MAG TPA: YhcH/YjgK/YiaL family protein [Ignavibacteriales bacterium]|nr:YhcH/YjgK/YiaL family protein [Ignavibacteriales bacterium]